MFRKLMLTAGLAASAAMATASPAFAGGWVATGPHGVTVGHWGHAPGMGLGPWSVLRRRSRGWSYRRARGGNGGGHSGRLAARLRGAAGRLRRAAARGLCARPLLLCSVTNRRAAAPVGR
jgi:hypothetical protein